MLAFERRWLLRVFEAILPSGADDRLTLGAKDVPMDRFVDDLLVRAPGQVRLGLRLSLWVLVLSPLFVIGRFATFVGLEPADQLRVLDKIGQSDRYLIRELPLLFKTIACMGFCGMPQVHEAVGIEPRDTRPPIWARDPD